MHNEFVNRPTCRRRAVPGEEGVGGGLKELLGGVAEREICKRASRTQDKSTSDYVIAKMPKLWRMCHDGPRDFVPMFPAVVAFRDEIHSRYARSGSAILRVATYAAERRETVFVHRRRAHLGSSVWLLRERAYRAELGEEPVLSEEGNESEKIVFFQKNVLGVWWTAVPSKSTLVIHD
ncbi:hypothetical protein B0H16DRAFT_1479706 [Mycena metata]|uniref:Uncharacterized protein n=1 Tax=Mycena metata TaxID=1033252 RepID=A0AAD7H4G3_9AGAR|nr:hypothetical protein B0H16DRAFT_1479706 [Mycena metata]